jgi:hypothetical protein
MVCPECSDREFGPWVGGHALAGAGRAQGGPSPRSGPLARGQVTERTLYVNARAVPCVTARRLVSRFPNSGKQRSMDERDREVAALGRIRSRFAAAAASGNERAKAIVATTNMIEMRRGPGRGKYAGAGRRPPAQ